MAVAAHTNMIGNFVEHELVESSRTHWIRAGYPWQALPPDTVDHVLVPTAFSAKSPTIFAGKKHATDYTREIHCVVKSTPETFRSVYQDPHEDYRFEFVRSIDLASIFRLDAFGPPRRFLADLDDCRSAAILKAREKLRSGRVQNGADLAQARSTFNMLAQDTTRVLNAWRALRRGNFALAARLLGVSPGRRIGHRELGSLWLELQYGWRPLLSSIHDNAELLRKGFESSPKSFKAKSTKKTEHSESFEWLGGQATVKSSGGAHVQYLSSIRDPGLAALDTFGLINPLEIGWELVPFSFVLDWFVPVGNILGSLSATAGLDFLDGFLSVRRQTDITYSRGDGVLNVSYFRFERTWLPGYLLPELYGKANPFSTEHGANALALLTQLLGNSRS